MSKKKKKKKCPEIKMKKKKNGYPILPNPEEWEGHELECKKILVGKFMRDIYGLSAPYPYY